MTALRPQVGRLGKVCHRPKADASTRWLELGDPPWDVGKVRWSSELAASAEWIPARLMARAVQAGSSFPSRERARLRRVRIYNVEHRR